MIFSLLQVTSIIATTTLGNLHGDTPFFRSNDHELNPTNTFGSAHVPGPLGHVWPGGGLNHYLSDTTLPPGYQSPFTTFEEPLQADANFYSPEGAILTSTVKKDNVGDLIFALNFSQPNRFPGNPVFRYNNITLYIPSPTVDKKGELLQDGFEPVGLIDWNMGDVSNIVTTLTDDYGSIFVSKADMLDPFGPGWWVIRISASGNGIEFSPTRDWREWYYIRINQLRSPDIAGRYFFKIFLGDHYPVKSQSSGVLINSTIPLENWPALLVKGEIDPAILYGTVKYGNKFSNDLYGQPIQLSGVVRAVGVATSPYTGESTGRSVEARGYFNASAYGHFEVEGIASGVYDIYASAAGFPERKVAENIKFFRGKSLNLNIYLIPGPEIVGEVCSKDSFGEISWPGDLPVSVVIYDSDNYIEDNVVSYSPINLTHSPYTSYVSGNTLFEMQSLLPPNAPKLVAFPWEGPLGYYIYTDNPANKDVFGLFNGVGPAQSWWVTPNGHFDPTTGLGSDEKSFIFQFGKQGYYGAPSQLSGMVPQIFASWISGLDSGTYFIRVFINGYIQTDASGNHFQDYFFTVMEDTLSSDLQILIDLRLSNSINVTVHFHDQPELLQSGVIGGPDPGRFLVAEVIDADGSLAAFNFTYVSSSSSSASILLNGLGMAGPITQPDPRTEIKYSLFRYRGLRDYGLYPGTYSIRLYLRGYIQAIPPANNLHLLDQPLTISVSIGDALTEVSAHMFRGGGLNVTVYSIDCQQPPSERLWLWNGTSMTILVFDVATNSLVTPIYFWDATVNFWNSPRTNSQYSTIPWPEWKKIYGPGATMLITNGSPTLERFGPDLPNIASDSPEQDIASNIFFQTFIHIGFLYSSLYYRGEDYQSTISLYPGLYAVNAWTYGYVQEGVVTLGDFGDNLVSVDMGNIADTHLKLIQGVEFNLTILFRKEGILSELPYNMSMRIRIYDDRDILIAAASTSYDIGAILSQSDSGFYADGTKVYSAGGSVSPIPAGTRIVEYRGIAGLIGYTDPTVGAEAVQRVTLFSPDQGVWGNSPYKIDGSYTGNWRVIIELVTWYRPSDFYPPAPALLQGELHLANLTSLLPYNHLGPYELRQEIIIPNVNLCESASPIIGLDQRGYLRGIINEFTYCTELRTASWVTVYAQGNEESYTSYSFDGFYDMYLPSGAFALIFEEDGYANQIKNIEVSEGSSSTINLLFYQNSIPIPEFSLNILSTTMIFSLLITYFARRGLRRTF